MAKIRPSSVLSLMPTDDVVNHSLRYLKTDSDDQSRRCRVVLLPFGEWGDCGFSIGRGVASLDFPDNSILFLSIQRSGSPAILLPPSNSIVDCPGGSFPSVDNGVIDYLHKNMGDVCSFSVDDIEDSEALLSLPMAVEASKMRRRGIPLCTPVVIGIPDDYDGWGDLSAILWEMMDGFGLGAVVHSPDITIPMTEGGGGIIKAAIQSLVPSFVGRAVRMTNPEMTPDIVSVELFQRLAWEIGGAIQALSESKSADEDGRMWFHHSFGISEHPLSQEPVPLSQRGPFWDAVLFSISSEGDEGSIPDVEDVIVEIRTEGVDATPSPDDGRTTSLHEAMKEIVRRGPQDVDWSNMSAIIEVRIHHGRKEVQDASHFRPKPGSSVMIEMRDGSRRLLMIPSDMRRTRTHILDVPMGEVERMISFDVQTLSTLRCLLSDPI